VRAGQGAATRGSARPEAATMARAAGDLAAEAAGRGERDGDSGAGGRESTVTLGREEVGEGEVAAASGACEGGGGRNRGRGGGNGGRR
jgi:hypothetical protein